MYTIHNAMYSLSLSLSLFCTSLPRGHTPHHIVEFLEARLLHTSSRVCFKIQQQQQVARQKAAAHSFPACQQCVYKSCVWEGEETWSREGEAHVSINDKS